MGLHCAPTTLHCQRCRSLVYHGGSDAVSATLNPLIPVSPCRKHYLHTWKIFCQAYHESPVQYEDGGWEREHSIYRKTFQLHCPDNKFISGFYTNYSERYLDHIWWLHCSSLDHSHFISNCSQVHQEHLLTPNRTASFFLPANLTVFTAVHSIYHRELL